MIPDQVKAVFHWISLSLARTSIIMKIVINAINKPVKPIVDKRSFLERIFSYSSLQVSGSFIRSL